MKAQKHGRRMVVSILESEEREARRRAWARIGPEAFEELVDNLRRRGVDIPETRYERRMGRRRRDGGHSS